MLDTYDLLETIGAGSFGHVYRAKDKATGEVIAIKLIDKVSLKTHSAIFVYFCHKLKRHIRCFLSVFLLLKTTFSFISPV